MSLQGTAIDTAVIGQSEGSNAWRLSPNDSAGDGELAGTCECTCEEVGCGIDEETLDYDDNELENGELKDTGEKKAEWWSAPNDLSHR
ncbi:hypothetical protein NDU88_002505 [Pleurodeles waltl]|uniref:Uncharacterized protein n=1 Tax=Pleurodeles waltl TaxID=8319 RepID=A0AAV7WLF3_PLEWA|nr:hypothetical protein NDU88_002505 [Pleurodeles waltl]